MNKFITIKTFTYSSEAVILKGRLESEEIACFVKDDTFSQIAPLYSNAIGGVKLQVKEEDIPAAIAILKEGGYLNDEDYEALKNYHADVEKHFVVKNRSWQDENRGIIIAAVILAVAYIIWAIFFKEIRVQ